MEWGKNLKRIAIDCRPLIGHRSGIGRYLYELLNQFARREDSVQFFLLAPAEIDIPDACKYNNRFMVKIHHMRPGILWLHTVVPWFIHKEHIDVFWGPNYAMPLIKKSDCRYVITIHDATYARYPETMYWVTRIHNQWMLPIYSYLSDCVITDSHFSRKELLEVLQLSDGHVYTVHLSASPPRVKPLEQFPMESPFILAVGTIEPRKNFKRLVAAYAQLPAYLKKEYHLVLAGAIGWGGLNPDDWFKEYKLEGNATYLGKVDEHQLATLYSKATLFVFPSLYEGFGLPILEAMSFGCPILCSRSSSLIEVADNAALFFDPTSVTDISCVLNRVLEDAGLRSELSIAGQKRSSEFSWGEAATMTLDLLIGGTVNDFKHP